MIIACLIALTLLAAVAVAALALGGMFSTAARALTDKRR